MQHFTINLLDPQDSETAAGQQPAQVAEDGRGDREFKGRGEGIAEALSHLARLGSGHRRDPPPASPIEPPGVPILVQVVVHVGPTMAVDERACESNHQVSRGQP